MDKNKNLIGKRVSYYNPYKNRTAYGIVVRVNSDCGIAVIRGNGSEQSPYQYNARIEDLAVLNH